MPRWSAAVAALCIVFSLVSAASAVELTLVRTSPFRDATLPRSGQLYLEVEYESAEPLRIQARAYRDGKPAPERQAMNASVLHPAGKRRALVWVSFFEPAAIDEIRVTAHDDRWQPLRILSVASRADWTKRSGAYRAPPQWVSDHIEAESRMADAHPVEEATGGGLVGLAIMAIAMIALPGYLVLQVTGLRRFAGLWRYAAGVPLLLMVPVALATMAGLVGSSNLWPLLLIFATPVAVLFLLALFAARRLWPQCEGAG